jgi:hypothetical protein
MQATVHRSIEDAEQALADLRLALYRRAAAGHAVSVDATLASEVFHKLKSTAPA